MGRAEDKQPGGPRESVSMSYCETRAKVSIKPLCLPAVDKDSDRHVEVVRCTDRGRSLVVVMERCSLGAAGILLATVGMLLAAVDSRLHSMDHRTSSGGCSIKPNHENVNALVRENLGYVYDGKTRGGGMEGYTR